MTTPHATSDLLTIANRGQAIASTNYFDSRLAKAGYFFLSWNAGAGRLLVPDTQKPQLRDMKTAEYVVVSFGPWIEAGAIPAVEVLFEDHTDRPYSLILSPGQYDRTLSESDVGSGFHVAVWTRGGEKQRLPGRLRKVQQVPCLEPWPGN